MLFGRSKSKFSPIAVDFGADSLKLLQVTDSEPPQIVAAAAADLPEHVRTDPTARNAFYQETLRSLLKMGPFKGKKVICSLPAYQTLIQHVRVGRAEGDEFTQEIHQHLRERLNIDPSRLVIRTVVVEHAAHDGAGKQEVICLAASHDSVMKIIQTLHACKLDVVGMHSEPQAILQAFSHLYTRAGSSERTTCFIDLGAATTKVIIAHGNEMVFAKAIHAAGDQITRHFAQTQNVSFAEARDARIRESEERPAEAKRAAATVLAGKPEGGAAGLAVMEAQMAAESGPQPGSPGRADASAGPAAKAAAECDTLECLIDELRLSVRYHQSIFPGRAIEKLVFLGGESAHVGTCQRIAKALRIGAQLGDPLARLSKIGQEAPAVGVDLKRAQPGWAVPMGLCLSEANL